MVLDVEFGCAGRNTRGHASSLKDLQGVSIALACMDCCGFTRSSPKEYDRYLKSKRFFEIEDSIDLYLIFVKEVRRRNEIAPLSHINPTLKQILLNKRKLETMRQFNNDILEEAIQNKTLEIYE